MRVNKKIIKLKIVGIELLRWLVRIFFFVPIKKNRILINSHIGKAYSCNPKYISEYLQNNYPGRYEIIWFFRKANLGIEIPQTKKILYKSLKWLYYTVTAKVIIGNDGAVWVPRRKNQLIIDTWHGGGCYKKVALANSNLDELVKYRTQISSREVNLYLSSSEYFSENIIRKNFKYSGKILESGMPRNDIFFQNENIILRRNLREKIAKQYSFEEDCFIILFAPTWRKKAENVEPLDIGTLKNVVEKCFSSQVIILGRGHHKENASFEKNIIDVTLYSDMQELLLATDMLITDYSSSIWDFSFTKKPCFLFVPDLESYKKNPGFERDIISWGFPVCETNSELMSAIENFKEEEHLRKMDEHHKTLVSYEKGYACQQVCDYINEFCKL